MFACGVNTIKSASYRGLNMRKEKYIVLYGNELIKTYKTFKEAVHDLDFLKLIYGEVYLYQLVAVNDDIIKGK